jgi:hypothetical protein
VADFDVFANQLLEEAKRFLEKAKESRDSVAEAAYLHAALMLSFCALEAQVNSIGEEFSIRGDLSAHEKGILLERAVSLENGEFQLQAGLKMARLEERIELLHAKFSAKPIDKSETWWSQLGKAINLRNHLTHPKIIPIVTESATRDAIQSIIDAIDALYRSIYKKKFPAVGQGLNSRLAF